MTTYLDSGVDISAGDELVERIKPLAKKTLREGVLAGIGGFGALFEVSKKYKDPVLVVGTDGVGTKLKMAINLNKNEGIGIDLVAMSVNDILVQGAEPLFFLDYFSCGKLNVSLAETVISGIADGCKQAGCALIGGETAEMPGMYWPGEYDLAGFAVGVVEKSKIIDGRNIKVGDVVIGLKSSGPHSNGYSLIRKILADNNIKKYQIAPYEGFWDEVMAPTRIYVKDVLNLISEIPVNGLAHITGGGLLENIPRILPENLCAELNCRWKVPRIFDWLQDVGKVDIREMYRVFNMGIGMVVIVDKNHVDRVLKLVGDMGLVIGEIVERDGEAVKIGK